MRFFLLGGNALVAFVIACGGSKWDKALQESEQREADERAELALEATLRNDLLRQREAELQAEPDAEDALVPETFDSAHRFISKVFGEQDVTLGIETYSLSGWNTKWYRLWNPRGTPDVQYDFPDSIIEGASPVDNCVTMLRVTHPETVRQEIQGEQVVFTPPVNPLACSTCPNNFPMPLRWEDATAVEQEEDTVLISGLAEREAPPPDEGTRPAQLRVTLASEAMATRIAYVFEFLRVYCQQPDDEEA